MSGGKGYRELRFDVGQVAVLDGMCREVGSMLVLKIFNTRYEKADLFGKGND